MNQPQRNQVRDSWLFAFAILAVLALFIRVALTQVLPTPTPVSATPTPVTPGMPTPTPTVAATPTYYPREVVIETFQFDENIQYVTPSLPVYSMIQVSVDSIVLQASGADIPWSRMQWYWQDTCIVLNGMLTSENTLTAMYVRGVSKDMLDIP